MNCRDFLKEFEERNALTEPATLHLNKCADCREINALQTRVWQVIDRFEPISAPNDFNFRVKARIADSNPGRFQPRFLPVLRYVLPLGLIVLISAFVVFNNSRSNSLPSDVARVAETQPPNTTEERKIISNVSETSNDTPTAITNADAIVVQSNEKKPLETFVAASRFSRADKSNSKPKTNVRRRETSDDDFKGWHTIASTGSQTMLPLGLNANKTATISPEFEINKPLTAKEILSQLGIEANFTGKGWLVKSVGKNSLAERSIVKVGDLVEAIDDEQLTGEPIRAKTFEGKKLTVVRGTEKKETTLRNQSN